MDGWTLLAEGRQAEVYLRPDGAVVKLMRDPDHGWWIDREVVAIEAVAREGFSVPEVLEVVEAGGRRGLAMTRVEGTDLMTVTGAKPWLVVPLGGVLGSLHASLHQCAGPGELPSLHDLLAERFESPDLSATQRVAARSALADLPEGDRLCHGDMHLGNLIGDRKAPVVIDWGGATRGPPIADVALTVLMHRLAQPGPGAPPLVRTLAPVGARVIIWRYEAAYRRQQPIDADLLERWVAVRAAARLGDDIADEREGLQQVVAGAFGP